MFTMALSHAFPVELFSGDLFKPRNHLRIYVEGKGIVQFLRIQEKFVKNVDLSDALKLA